MCGIAGIWNLNKEPLTEHKLKKFTDSLSHRGPDGAGYYIDKASNLGLGHRRLSILDLSIAGKQPMNFANERYWISYNGEVFNFIELRSELKNQGYTFVTETDTEIILAAYHCWGVDCLNKFNGMWAMAIWDSVEKNLFLARDRFGIKPLFYSFIPNSIFAFASETYAFKFLENYKRSFNEKNVALQIKDPNTLEGIGYTIFENIYQLLPGHYMIVSENKPNQQKRWWNTLDNLQDVPLKYEDQVEKFKELLINSMQLRLRSDVPVATALSGGVDSSSVFCSLNYMMKHMQNKERMPSNWQQAFVATFPDTLSDERKFAEKVVDFTSLKGTYITLDDRNLLGQIIETTVKSDSIIGAPIVASFMIYEAMRKSGISVSMDGHGVDEMLYGYPWLVKAAYNYYNVKNDITNMQDIEQTYVDLFYDDTKEIMRKQFRNEFAKKSSLQNIKNKIKSTPLNTIYEKIKNNNTVSILPQLSDKPYNSSNLNSSEKMLFDCFHKSTLPEILKIFDRSSMQNSIEVRMPFMDYRLVSYVFSLPMSSKIGNGYTKRILRDAMQGIMPNDIRERKLKVGLMAPMYDWFNTKMGEVIIDEVNSTAFLNSDLWNGKEIATYATQKSKSKTWQGDECSAFWTIFNAHLLQKNN